MTSDCSRRVYLARHAEPEPDGARLTARGARQAELLGHRLMHLPLSRVVHGPLPRAAQTARIVADQLDPTPTLSEQAVAGDYVPHVPDGGEVPEPWADAVLSSFDDVTDDEATSGSALGRRAIDLLAATAHQGGSRVELVLTHAFTIGWLLCHALDAPTWRWWGLDHCHAGLTVLEYRPQRPPTLLVWNDTSHLPEDLRWTGFPEEYRV